MSCSLFGPGTTATSSHPSSPQLSRICLVACTSSGTVTYFHLVMALTLAPGRPHAFARHAFPARQAFALGGFARQAFGFADAITGGELECAVGLGRGHLGHRRYLRLAERGGRGVRDRRLGLRHLLVTGVLRLLLKSSRRVGAPWRHLV